MSDKPNKCEDCGIEIESDYEICQSCCEHSDHDDHSCLFVAMIWLKTLRLKPNGLMNALRMDQNEKENKRKNSHPTETAHSPS